MGLTVSPTKSEVVVFHRRPLDSELALHVASQLSPVSVSHVIFAELAEAPWHQTW